MEFIKRDQHLTKLLSYDTTLSAAILSIDDK